MYMMRYRLSRLLGRGLGLALEILTKDAIIIPECRLLNNRGGFGIGTVPESGARMWVSSNDNMFVCFPPVFGVITKNDKKNCEKSLNFEN